MSGLAAQMHCIN